MADKVVGQAVLQISLDEQSAKRVTDALKNISTESEKTGKSVKNMSQLFSANMLKDFAKTAVSAIGTVTSTIVELGERGAAVADVSGSFDTLAQRAGGAKSVLEGLRAGTVGTISDFDLMSTANRALGAGFIKSADDAKTLARGAKVLADATGGTTSEAFDKLTNAMAKGQTRGLKGLGVFVDSRKAIDDYSRATGRSITSLTDEDKATINVQASMKALRDRIAEMGPQSEDFADKIDQAKVSLANVKDQIAVNVAQSPVLQAGLAAIGEQFTKAFGGKDEFVTVVTRAIEVFVIILAKTASVALSVAEVVVGAFFAWKTAFNSVIAFIYDGMTKFHGVIGQVAGALADLTGINAFKTVEENAARAKDQTSSLALGFHEVAEESNASGAAALSALGKTKTALAGTVAAMESQRGKVLEVKAATDDLNQATGAGGEAAARRSQEADKAALEGKRSLLDQELALGRVGLDQKRIAIEQEAMSAAVKVMENKTLTQQEADFMLAKIEEIKAKKLAIAQAEGDELKQKRTDLQNELLLINQTGIDAELTALGIKQQKELQALEVLKINYPQTWAQLSGLVKQKYAEMTADALGHFSSAEEAAAASGLKTRAELQNSANKAHATYALMKQSGKFTYQELQTAHEAYKEAENKLNETSAQASAALNNATVDAVVQGLQMLAGKSKAAAIAAVIISTAQAVMKTWAQLGFPAAIPGAAIAVATGAIQIAKIKSQDSGHRTGTPWLDFKNFGSETATTLHGKEAVIPQGRGHQLAGEIAGALPGAGGGMTASMLDRLADRIIGAPINPVSVDVTLDGIKLGEALLSLSRTGTVRIHTSSLVTS